jgi:DNA-binding transcriptional MerR regulator
VAGLRAATPKVSIQDIKGVDAEIKATTAAISAANRFAAAKDEKTANATLGGFLTATGLTPEEVDAEVKNRSAGLFTGPSKKEARQQFAAERIQELRDKLEQLKGDRASLVGGQAAAQPAATAAAPVTPTTAAAPSGQAASESDMVIAQIPGNEPMKMSREQAARAKQKYPNLVITPVR